VLAVAIDGVHVGPIGGRERLAVALGGERHQPAKAQDQVERPAQLVTHRNHKARLVGFGQLGLHARLIEFMVHALDAVGGLLERAHHGVKLPAAEPGLLHLTPGPLGAGHGLAHRQVQVSHGCPNHAYCKPDGDQ